MSLASTILLVASVAGAEPPLPAGLSSAEALRLGQRMFREGILPGGGSMQALVSGDIPAEGEMFTCVHCHRRSGLGSFEGRVVTWPITGQKLFQPRRRTGAWRPPANEAERSSGPRSLPPQHRAPDARPAYTDETLARALRNGVDPTGRTLDATMPRYRLNDRNMAILVHYLRHLSDEVSPGVESTTIRFATVVSDGVPSGDREAMLAVLQDHVEAHNSQTRYQERRARWGPFQQTEENAGYRRMELVRWELTGARETWRSQLEAHYLKTPVFGLLGGMVTGSWAPVHEFCEEHRIPALFPITDLPVVSGTDWYTLYFSRGLRQEGEAAAAYLRGGIGSGARIVQVFRRDHPGEAVAGGFRETWAKLGGATPVERVLAPNEVVGDGLWAELAGLPQQTVVLVWIDAEAFEALRRLAGTSIRPKAIFASTSLMRGDLAGVPDSLKGIVYLTHPYSLPDESKPRRFALESYLRVRKIPVRRPEVEAKTWFLGNLMSRALSEMRSEFHRDYFLEKLEMMANQESGIAVYPRLTFGPDQRYASKGCYIVQLAPGPSPALVKRSDWVIPQERLERASGDASPPATSGNGPSSIEDRWGVQLLGVRLSAAGAVLEFRFRVLDPGKALSLTNPNRKPYLVDRASGARLVVPGAPKAGAQRQAMMLEKPKADRTYSLLFTNPGRAVQAGSKVTVVIGGFWAELTVEAGEEGGDGAGDRVRAPGQQAGAG